MPEVGRRLPDVMRPDRSVAERPARVAERSATEPIDDTSTGKRMDGVLAARNRTFNRLGVESCFPKTHNELMPSWRLGSIED
jgi:hypothetical protein